ncbi:MAG: cupredoxin family copper-binding protein [Thermoleophilaceae bacterium]|nr:cupredoxin family copper-binding protein [Thermoleophilaceae bacterium]
MTRLLALLFACLALGLVAAGCGGDDDGGDGGSGSSADTQEQPAPAAEGGGTEVSMKDIKFNPGEVTVKPGDTVTWTNDDTAGHDVTGDNFKSGDAGALQTGDTFEHTFDKAGTFDYVCTVHPGMKGTVKVE